MEALDIAVETIDRELQAPYAARLSVRLVVLDERAFRHARAAFPTITSSELDDASVRGLSEKSRPSQDRSLDSHEGTSYYRDVEWRMRDETFSELYNRLLDRFLDGERSARVSAGVRRPVRGRFVVTKAAVARRADIDYEYFKRLCRRDSTVNPGKDKVVALAMAIRLDRRMTERLLRVAGHSLNPHNRRDTFILASIGTPVWEEAQLSQALVDAGYMRLMTGG